MTWLGLSFLSLLSYAIWGVMNGVVTKQMGPYDGLFFSGIGYILSGIFALYLIEFRVQYTFRNLLSGVGLGLATGIGGLFLLLAAQRGGNANVIIVVTSLYPLITLLLNFMLFNLPISQLQVGGAILAIVAIIMVSVG